MKHECRHPAATLRIRASPGIDTEVTVWKRSLALGCDVLLKPQQTTRNAGCLEEGGGGGGGCKGGGGGGEVVSQEGEGPQGGQAGK